MVRSFRCGFRFLRRGGAAAKFIGGQFNNRVEMTPVDFLITHRVRRRIALSADKASGMDD